MSCFVCRGAVDADGRIEPGDMILAVSESLFLTKFLSFFSQVVFVLTGGFLHPLGIC